MEQKNKSEKYIYKQKNKYMKSINKTQKFLEAFTLASKKGDLDILASFLKETEKRAEFVESILYDVWNDYAKSDPGLLSKFAVQLGIDELTDRFGQEFGDRLNQANINQKLNYLDVQQLLLVQQKAEIEKANNPYITEIQINEIKKSESQKMCKLFDLFTNDNLVVGIHRTGGAVSGEQIEQQGLFLTGHMSSGVINDYDNGENVEKTLEKNISFFDKPVCAPGSAIRQICVGGNYKNLMQKEKVDIVLVGIPRDKLESNDQSILLKDGYQKTLNPEYVIGYVTVNTNSNTIDSISENRYRKNDLWKTQNNLDYRNNAVLSNDELKLKQCYEIARQPENRGILKKAFDCIKGLVRGKDNFDKGDRPSLSSKESKER